MKRRKASVLGAVAAAGMVLAVSGPVRAANPPGRGASAGGLSTAVQKVREAASVPTDQISLNIKLSQDGDQPGVTPVGGGIEP